MSIKHWWDIYKKWQNNNVNINITYHDYARDYTKSESYAREYVATSLKLLA